MADQEMLGRDYVLHEEIGRGPLGVVRRATSRHGGPPLAAELLRPDLAADPRVRQAFAGEEAALRDLDHPAVARVRDLVTEDGRLALLTDHVDGPSLRHLLTDRGGRLLALDAAAVAAQLAAALAAAHVQGIVHLDLRPETIATVRGSEPPEIRVRGFGVAALLLDAGADGRSMFGEAPGYTAPEVLAGSPATAPADMYSLGVLMAEMVTGARPGSAIPDIAGAGLPHVLIGIARACLADDPRDRPAARVLAARLRTVATAASALRPTGGPAPAPTFVDADRPDTPLRPGFAGSVSDPPAPKDPARWRRGPLITLAAGVAVAAVLAALSMTAASRDRAGRTAGIAGPPAVVAGTPATEAPIQAPEILPPTTPLAASAPADRTRATFAGHVDNKGGTLAISLRDGRAIAYICDGKRLEAWLKGTASDGRFALKGKNGAAITGTFSTGGAQGRVTAAGRTNSFTLGIASKPSGLYRAATKVRNADVVGSWIVLPDGGQVGVLTEAGRPEPAPALDVTSRITTVGGTQVAATTIDVDTGEGF
jgi:serine/threonine-protein kinase